jgi:gas vesicle protein
LHLADGMSSVRMLLAGLVIGAVLGGAAALAFGDEPSLTIRNGVLKGWAVTKDDEKLICTDPMIFIRAKQIECE